MRLEILKGSYFIFDGMSSEDVYKLQEWLYFNGFEGNIERNQIVYRNMPIMSYGFSFENPYIENRQEIGFLLNYRNFSSRYSDYKTEFIKDGMCIVNTGSHLLFLEPGEYEILQNGLKILPNE
jgi:hypothetical protein